MPQRIIPQMSAEQVDAQVEEVAQIAKAYSLNVDYEVQRKRAELEQHTDEVPEP